MNDSAKTSGLVSFRHPRSAAQPIGGWLKRGTDIAGALFGLVLLSPLFLMLAALVKFSDGGRIFYGHKRIGYDGREFFCLKFRTMVENSDQALTDYLAARPEARCEWDTTRKLKFDPRVSRVGHVLRRLSLDELPQLINILRGEMSIVGPRPVTRDELEKYGATAAFYLKTRPGLTGLWQISGRNDVSYDIRVKLDRHYAENWNLSRDLEIIAKTIPAVYMAKGSY